MGLGGGGILKLSELNSLSNFTFDMGGGYSETEKSQSAKIYLNLNFPVGGGSILQLKNHKVPRSA